MGEYYIATLLDSAGHITRAVNPTHYGSSERLGPHSRDATPFLIAVETLLALDGGSRLVWAGDYADNEPGHDTNLYWAIQDHQFIRFEGLIDPDAGAEPNMPRPAVELASHFYVCNADKRQLSFVKHFGPGDRREFWPRRYDSRSAPRLCAREGDYTVNGVTPGTIGVYRDCCDR